MTGEEARRPTVAVVAHGVDDSGGMERVHAELVRRLLNRYRFEIVSSELASDLRCRVVWHRVRVPRRPAPLREAAFYLLGGARLRTTRADLVHLCGALVPSSADLASVHFCHRGFVTANDRLVPRGMPPLRRVNAMLERWLALATERRSYRPDHLRLLAAVSSQVGEELRNAYPGVPIRETPNGVDLDRFRPDLRAREVVRRALKVDERTLVVIFVGGDWHRKGLSVAIEAAAAGLVGDMPWELWVVGAGDERRFARQAAAVGLRGAVRFLGPLGDVERYYQAADIYLCCSEYEALSLALLEAAASGLPIVTTPVGGVAELRAESGDDGGVLVRSSLHEIGSALSKLSADPARRAAYGQAARRRAEHFGWEPLANQIDALYQELLQDRTIGRSGIPLAPVRRQHGE